MANMGQSKNPGTGKVKSTDSTGQRQDKKGQQDPTLLHPMTPWFLTAVTSAVRVHHVVNPSNWWLLHSDEIFQSMEVAHSELYGYGLRPYEFIPPAKGDNVSHYAARERELGMNALRSPLLPQFFMLISLVTSWLGLEPNPYLLWRVSHAMVTSWLPLVVAVYVRQWSSWDTATVASVLTATSSHLNTFGSHSLVNSFISPFLFLALSCSLKLLSQEPPVLVHRRAGQKPDMAKSRFRTENCANGQIWRTPLALIKHVLPSVIVDFHQAIQERRGKLVNMKESGQAASVCNKDEQWDAGNSRNETIDHIQEKKEHLTPGRNVKAFLSGLLLVLCIYIRPDSSLLVTLLIISCIKVRRMFYVLGQKSVGYHLAGAGLGLTLAVTDDVYFYGSCVVSPYNWVRFNVFSNMSSQLFGSSGAMFYVYAIFVYNGGMCVLSLLFAFIILIVLMKAGLQVFNKVTQHVQFHTINGSKMRKFMLESVLPPSLCDQHMSRSGSHSVCVIMVSILFSSVGHKESRFLHDILVLFFICVSGLIVTGLHVVLPATRPKQVILLLLLLSFSLTQWPVFHFHEETEHRADLSKSRDSGADVNQCLYYISSQKDVTGIFLDRQIYDTASFSILHKKVPLIFVHGFQYLELDDSSLITSNHACYLNDNCTPGYFSFHTVSDLIHLKNSQYLFKRLLQSPVYNYAIIKAGQPFFQPAFVEVFKTRTFSVWKRKNDPVSEAKMAALVADISSDRQNSTILEYEAEVLKQLGNYKMALQRFQAILQSGTAHVSIYASTTFSFYRMNNEKEMKKILKICLRKYARHDCLDGGRPRVLKLGSGFRTET